MEGRPNNPKETIKSNKISFFNSCWAIPSTFIPKTPRNAINIYYLVIPLGVSWVLVLGMKGKRNIIWFSSTRLTLAWRQHILEGIGRPLPMKDTKNFIVNAAVVLVITYKTGNNLEI